MVGVGVMVGPGDGDGDSASGVADALLADATARVGEAADAGMAGWVGVAVSAGVVAGGAAGAGARHPPNSAARIAIGNKKGEKEWRKGMRGNKGGGWRPPPAQIVDSSRSIEPCGLKGDLRRPTFQPKLDIPK